MLCTALYMLERGGGTVIYSIEGAVRDRQRLVVDRGRPWMGRRSSEPELSRTSKGHTIPRL
jgi:hypothetical protein